MAILGVVIRANPRRLQAVVDRLGGMPGVDLALNPGDGRLVAVMEDALGADGTRSSAATALAEVAQWPEVLSTSLVYEYSGDEVEASGQGLPLDYGSWRDSLRSNAGLP